MVVGYNHNIMYKGEVYHVQTEDSGINTPHIITLLYRGGNIIASKKTSYADIVKMGNLSQVVEELMKEQHKDMLRRLKSAEFDAKLGIAASPVGSAPADVAPVTASSAAPVSVTAAPQTAAPVAAVASAPPQPAVAAKPVETLQPKPVPAPPPPAAPVAASPPEKPATPPSQPKHNQSLDDLIFDFLSSGDDRH